MIINFGRPDSQRSNGNFAAIVFGGAGGLGGSPPPPGSTGFRHEPYILGTHQTISTAVRFGWKSIGALSPDIPPVPGPVTISTISGSTHPVNCILEGNEPLQRGKIPTFKGLPKYNPFNEGIYECRLPTNERCGTIRQQAAMK